MLHARTHARTLVACAISLLGCTHDELARQDIDNGVGVLKAGQGGFKYDDTVPGGKYSTLTVDDGTIDPLRQILTQLFNLDDPNVEQQHPVAHAVLIVNPTPATLPLTGCTAGKQHLCLRLFRSAEPEPSVNLLPGIADGATSPSSGAPPSREPSW